MEIEQSFKKETVWKLNFGDQKFLIFKAIEDSATGIVDVSISAIDAKVGTRIEIDVNKDRFLNLAGVIESFNQVCLGVEPVLAEEGYAEEEPEEETVEDLASVARDAVGNIGASGSSDGESADAPASIEHEPAAVDETNSSGSVDETNLSGSVDAMLDEMLGDDTPPSTTAPEKPASQRPTPPPLPDKVLGERRPSLEPVRVPQGSFAPVSRPPASDESTETDDGELDAAQAIDHPKEESRTIRPPSVAFPPKFPDQRPTTQSAEDPDDEEEEDEGHDDSTLEWDPW